MKTVKERLIALRALMAERGIAAYIVPGTDPHASEYIAEHWKEREWISGFTGSAGTAVILLEEAGLWTDSRYFLQGDAELAGTGIVLMKDGEAGTPSINEWIVSKLADGEKVAVNAEMFSVTAFASMQAIFASAGLDLDAADLIREVWTDGRPELPAKPFYVLDEAYSGCSAADKLTIVRAEMAKRGADIYVVSALDDIAWLLNIRGTDVDYNPVVISYVTITASEAVLYVAPQKMTDDLKAYLAKNGVSVADYDQILPALSGIDEADCVFFDPAKLNRALYDAIPLACNEVVSPSVITLLKSKKNEVELAGVKRAMLEDGVALVRHFMWLEEAVKGGSVTECDVMTHLTECRAKGKNFKGESFGTIAGYNTNGAIVHYHALADSCATLSTDGMLLIDSGGQYLDGTTDITRTVALGAPSDKQRCDYTLVLKGHLAISVAKFPKGTRGAQLDALARQFLWAKGLSYTHGTGHGVGHFLCVHEGPQGIRLEENPTQLECGMILSNEPGLYRTGEYGIRIENLVTVVPDVTTEFGEFLRFDTLTLYPYDRKLINAEMLTSEEIQWVNAFHKRVLDTLSPYLTEPERTWLQDKCTPIE